jgi:hypothetical protein
MAGNLKRPGGELYIFGWWIVRGLNKIQSLNYAIRQTIPDMKKAQGGEYKT